MWQQLNAKFNLTRGANSAPRSNAHSLSLAIRETAGSERDGLDESEKNENETSTESQEIGPHVIRLSLFSPARCQYMKVNGCVQRGLRARLFS